MAKNNINIEELQEEASEYESAKISLPETIIFVMLAASADAFEIFGVLIASTKIGLPIKIMALFYGIFVSAIIIMWLLLKGARGRSVVKFATKRLIAFIGGALLDLFTAGLLPIRTFVLIITIWLNNHFSDKDLERVLALLKKFNNGTIKSKEILKIS